MVRHPDKVTGIRSGFKAAGKEFGYGMYDGVSGIITQPIHGAKQEGFGGFVKGVGKGIGGFLLKPQAAFFSLPAYTMSGIYKELQKQVGSGVHHYIMAARTAQGYEDLATSSQQERLDVVRRWQATQIELHNEKQQLKDNHSHPPECVFLRVKNAAHSSLEEKRKHTRNGKLHKAPVHAVDGSSARERNAGTSNIPRHSASADHLEQTNSDAFEDAIQQSVEATSRGDPKEDLMIERAIRASVLELRASWDKGEGDQAFRRVTEASMAGAARARAAMLSSNETSTTISNNDSHQALQHKSSTDTNTENNTVHSLDHFGVGVDECVVPAAGLTHSDVKLGYRSHDDMQLKDVMEQSLLTYDQHAGLLEKEKMDEEIVLEYVKKQSLLEEEYRRSFASERDAIAASDKDGRRPP